MQVGELKTHFSEVLEEVQSGRDVIISYGKKKTKIAVIVPYKTYSKGKKRTLGILKDEKFSISKDFKIGDEAFLNA